MTRPKRHLVRSRRDGSYVTHHSRMAGEWWTICSTYQQDARRMTEKQAKRVARQIKGRVVRLVGRAKVDKHLSAVAKAAIAWWASHRPISWNLMAHLAEPRINVVCDPGDLVISIVTLLMTSEEWMAVAKDAQ